MIRESYGRRDDGGRHGRDATGDVLGDMLARENLRDTDRLVENLTKLIDVCPEIAETIRHETVADYLRPATSWTPRHATGTAALLDDLIRVETGRLYGPDVAGALSESLGRGRCAETAGHCGVPRASDKSSAREDGHDNRLLTLGQLELLGVATEEKRPVQLIFPCTRTPLHNPVSASYLDLSDSTFRLISNKHKDVPHLLLPDDVFVRAAAEGWNGQMAKLETRHRLRQVCDGDVSLVREATDILGREGRAAKDAVLVCHATLLGRLLPDGAAKPVTLDKDVLVSRYVAELMDVPESLIGRVTRDAATWRSFVGALSDIQTGWSAGDPRPFLKATGRSLVPFGVEDPRDVQEDLRASRVIVRGPLLFAALIGDGGLASIGGMSQCVYASQIKERVARFLRDELGDHDGAEAASEVPTSTAILLRAWGAESSGGAPNLLSFTTLWNKGGVTSDELSAIAGASPLRGVLTASHALSALLMPDAPPPGRRSIETFALFTRNAA